jgi:hypothetical protein
LAKAGLNLSPFEISCSMTTVSESTNIDGTFSQMTALICISFLLIQLRFQPARTPGTSSLVGVAFLAHLHDDHLSLSRRKKWEITALLTPGSACLSNQYWKSLSITALPKCKHQQLKY